jgi:hypothetical protein
MFRVRLRCGIGGATQVQSVQFNQQYPPNTTPRIEQFNVTAPGLTETLAGEAPWAVTVPRGAALDLSVAWPACSAADAALSPSSPCGGAERYLRYDGGARQLVWQRESLRVAWYTSVGDFALGSSGRGVDDAERNAGNRWQAPEAAQSGWWWLVLRDDRGGVSWRTVRVTVK